MCASAAHAQTASQITQRSYAPPAKLAGGIGIVIEGQSGLDVPPGAEKLTVTLSRVEVDGGFPDLAEAEAAIRAGLAGRRVTGAEIFVAARRLEAAYAKAGYALARVGLPPQRLVDGSPLKLIVVDGAIERVEIKDGPTPIRARIQQLLAPLVGKTHLMLAEMERRILFAGDLPGVLIRSTLAPGTKLGATVLVIEVKHQLVDEVLSYDNSLPASLGRSQIGVGADVNGALGFGELLYLRANGDPVFGDRGLLAEFARNRILAAGFVAPIGVDGLSFNGEVTQARTTPLPSGGLATTDLFDRLSLRLRYALIRSRQFDLSGQVALDVENETQNLLPDALGSAIADDRLRVLRLSGDADFPTPWGATMSAEQVASFGLDALGARTAAEAAASNVPLSRQGADARFAKWEATVTYAQNLAEHLSVNFNAHGQTSFGAALARAEQIGVAGPGALSAFDVGALQGDSGYVLRGEIGAPFALPQIWSGVGALATPYVFAAGGEIFLARPTALERSRVDAGSFGGGLKLAGGQAGSLRNVTLTFEVGRQLRNDNVPAENRFTLVAGAKF